MKQSKNKWWKNGWVWGALVLLIVSAAFGLCAALYNWQCTCSKVTAIVLSSLATIASFFCGVRAHAKQTNELEEILLLIKGIGNELAKIGNVNFTESACTVYVKLMQCIMLFAIEAKTK